MKKATLVYLFNNENQVLLCTKKRGFAMGKINGIGGKVGKGEDIQNAAKRELQEETGIILNKDNLKSIGIIHILWETKPERDVDIYLFMGNHNGKFIETEEVKPQRYDTKNIPYDLMWDSDKHFLPRVINNETDIEYIFILQENGDIVNFERIN